MLRAMQLAELVAKRDDSANDPRLWSNVLAEVPLFAALGRRNRRKVADAARIRRFRPGTVIMKAGRPGEALHVVLDGEVAVRRSGRRGLTLGPGSVVGELAMLDGGPRTATVLAKGELVTLTIGRARFRKLLASEPQLGLAVAEELARRLRSVMGGDEG